jgi:hypothetical protein
VLTRSYFISGFCFTVSFIFNEPIIFLSTAVGVFAVDILILQLALKWLLVKTPAAAGWSHHPDAT